MTVICLGPQRSSAASNVDFWSKKNVLLSPQSGIVMIIEDPSNAREVADPESAPCLGGYMALVTYDPASTPLHFSWMIVILNEVSGDVTS